MDDSDHLLSGDSHKYTSPAPRRCALFTRSLRAPPSAAPPTTSYIGKISNRRPRRRIGRHIERIKPIFPQIIVS
ncbi:hypothetical protein EVAR_9011_1 [Eumeta japonica]|uniref:Uncharacterized protein n=1 Tax=Eumeta variegata TaxID=151549 RepID=A0A4C1TVX6_EUMVA|nr:hypothetical protein EVAR_9011_1 [Eumeta japonica]